jgi:hypothetical protein
MQYGSMTVKLRRNGKRWEIGDEPGGRSARNSGLVSGFWGWFLGFADRR